jgi:HPt (histidine-containing phosphotransfer) domain-containing protein
VEHGCNPSPDFLPIDWQQLQALSDGNEEFELELLKIFVIETHKLLQIAQKAALEHQIDTLCRVAHQIKGSSGNVGLQKVFQIARQLEQYAKDDDLGRVMTLIMELYQSLYYLDQFLEVL